MNKPGGSPASPNMGVVEGSSPGVDDLVQTFNQLRDELVSTLMYMLGNRDDAQDAAQEAFLKCWRNQHSLPDIQNVRAWIFLIALNTARDMQRSAWNRKARPLIGEENMFATQETSPSEQMEDRESLELLRRAIQDLRSDEKEVFLLRQNGGLTYEQIAEIRNAPVGTVKTQMRTAVQKLRKLLA